MTPPDPEKPWRRPDENASEDQKDQGGSTLDRAGVVAEGGCCCLDGCLGCAAIVGTVLVALTVAANAALALFP